MLAISFSSHVRARDTAKMLGTIRALDMARMRGRIQAMARTPGMACLEALRARVCSPALVSNLALASSRARDCSPDWNSSLIPDRALDRALYLALRKATVLRPLRSFKAKS